MEPRIEPTGSGRVDACPDLVVYTLGWRDDHARKDGERPNAQIHGRVTVNGEEVKFLSGVTLRAGGNEFMTVELHVFPGSVRFVSLTEDEFGADELPT